MIELLNLWSMRWWSYFIPLVIQNTLFLVLIYGVLIYLKKTQAQVRYSIALLGLIKLLIPAFLPITWISMSQLSDFNFGIPSLFAGAISSVNSNIAPTSILNVYSMLLLVWITISAIMMLSPLIAFWRVKFRLRQSDLIETISNNADKPIQLYKTDSVALPMTIGIRSKKIYVPKLWENWSKEYRAMAIEHEISHIDRHDGLISGIQTVAQALYFFHPLVWLLNRRFDELREMVCDELAIDAQANDSITYSHFLADVAENMVRTQVDYPTMTSLLKKKKELFNRIQYLMEDKMPKPKSFTRFLVPTLICTAFLLSWNCKETNSLTSQSTDQINQENTVINKSSVSELKSIPYDSLSAFITAINFNPKYPVRVQSGGKEGTTIIKGYIDEDGLVEETFIIKVKGFPNSELDRIVNSNPPPPPPTREVKFIPYDSPPSPLSSINPKYPESAKESGIEGTVIIQAFIDEKGFVDEAIVLKGVPNSELDEAAVEAIKAVRFKPAKQKGKPVGVWISIPVNFRLDSKTE